MKRYLLLFLCCMALTAVLRAQRDNDQEIQDSVIGWWGNNRFDHLKPQTDPMARKKEAIVNDMVKWMKASYTPLGGLGTSSRYIGARGCGVAFAVWNVSHDKEWTEPNGNFRPISEENTPFYLGTNRMFGSWPISFINTGPEFYFTIQSDSYADNSQAYEDRQHSDPRIHPNCYKYITWVNEWCQVFLAPNNKLPWTPVTRGELLDKAEAGLEKVAADNRKEVAGQWPDSKKSQDEAIAVFQKTIEKYRSNIHQLRQRYSNTLNQPSVIRSWQTNMYSFETDPDIFKIDASQQSRHQTAQVYKLDAATYAKMNDVEPQWVCLAFPFKKKEDGNQKFELFTAMSENINYEYIYDYFYAPDKIKGKLYTAADAEGLSRRLTAYRSTRGINEAKVFSKQALLKDGVLLYDDFSQEPVGTKPAGWFFNSTGQAHVVTTVPGENGKWLKLGYNNNISPTTVKMLPENFSLEFDLVSGPFDGRWDASVALEMRASNKDKSGSSMRLEIGAGNQSALDAGHDYRGEVRISLINTPSQMPYNDGGGYYNAAQPLFTSSHRKVRVRLVKKGDGIVVYLNGKELVNSTKFKTKYGKDCGDCSIPAGTRYEGLTIQSTTQEAGTVGCYIGNIQFRKE